MKDFWNKFLDSETGLRYCYGKIESKVYKTPQEIISDFKDSDFAGNERIVFNINRNKYRLIAAFNYDYQICFVKFIGTHKMYDIIDAESVEFND